jgi:ACT domain-containing protein
MILTYRPELENPPMAKECSMGFSFLPQGEERRVTHFRVESGVNRNFDADVWERIKDYTRVRSLLSLGALQVTQEIDITAEHVVDSPTEETLESIDLKSALNLIDMSFDMEQLNKWNAKDQRIRVKNAIAKRITSITEGNG